MIRFLSNQKLVIASPEFEISQVSSVITKFNTGKTSLLLPFTETSLEIPTETEEWEKGLLKLGIQASVQNGDQEIFIELS